MTVATTAASRCRVASVCGGLAATVRGVPLHATVAGLCLLWLVPTVGLFVNSFRPPQLVASTGWWTALVPPVRFTLQNYSDVLSTYHLGRGVLNTLIIAIPGTVIPVTVAAFAAYALAWMRFGGREMMFAITVGLLIIPLQLTLVPVFGLLTRLGLVGTFPAAWLAHTAYGLPLAMYLLRNFMTTIPRDLLSAVLVH